MTPACSLRLAAQAPPVARAGRTVDVALKVRDLVEALSQRGRDLPKLPNAVRAISGLAVYYAPDVCVQ